MGAEASLTGSDTSIPKAKNNGPALTIQPSLEEVVNKLTVNGLVNKAIERFALETPGVQPDVADIVAMVIRLQNGDKVKNPEGRPDKYNPDDLRIVRIMAKSGATDVEIADELHIDISTLYRWKNKFPEFCDAMAMGKKGPNDRVEASLYRRATGYNATVEKINVAFGQVIRTETYEHIPPDPKAAAMWLTNRRRSKWAMRQEITGKDGADLMPKGVTDLTEAQLLAIASASMAEKPKHELIKPESKKGGKNARTK